MEVKHAGVCCHIQIQIPSERLSESPHVELKGMGWCLNERIWLERLTREVRNVEINDTKNYFHSFWMDSSLWCYSLVTVHRAILALSFHPSLYAMITIRIRSTSVRGICTCPPSLLATPHHHHPSHYPIIVIFLTTSYTSSPHQH